MIGNSEAEDLTMLAGLACIEFSRLKIRNRKAEELFECMHSAIMHLNIAESRESKSDLFISYQNALAFAEDCREILKDAGIPKIQQSRTLKLLESELKAVVKKYRAHQYDIQSVFNY